jgi:hypothetical protein
MSISLLQTYVSKNEYFFLKTPIFGQSQVTINMIQN